MNYLRSWSDVALLSRAYVLHVFQRCWKTSRDLTDMPQSDIDNIHVAAMATAFTSMCSWLFQHFKTCPIIWHSTDRKITFVSLFCFVFDQPKKPGRTFYKTTWEIQIKGVEVDKRLHPKLHWISEQKRKDSSTVQIEPQRIKATALLHHVDTLIFIWRNQDCSQDIPEKQ